MSIPPHSQNNSEPSISYSPQQAPSSLLPGQRASILTDPLGTKARERIDRIVDVTRSMLNGKQPVLGGSKRGDKWIISQLYAMDEKGFLPEESAAYYKTRRKDRVLGYNPVSNSFVDSIVQLKKELAEINSPAIRIAGDGFATRTSGDFESIRDINALTIAIPGDLYALSEIAQLIATKMNKDPNAVRHPLIIESITSDKTGAFWDNFLRSIKILDLDLSIPIGDKNHRRFVDLEALAYHYGIYITGDREQTLNTAQTLYKEMAKHRILPQPQPEKPLVPEDGVIFIATGTMKKFDQIKATFKAQGISTKIRSIFHLVEAYVSPKETSATYEGNVAEKVEAALSAWENMPEAERTEILIKIADDIKIDKNLTLSERAKQAKSKIFILGEDSGFHFEEPNLLQEDEFRHVAHKVNQAAPFPGVETGPATIGNNGVHNFFYRVEQIFNRRPNPNHKVIHNSVLALAPLEQPHRFETTMQMVSGKASGTWTSTAMPATGPIEIDNFLIPDCCGGKTEAELGTKYTLEDSPRAIALRTLATMSGIEMSPGREVASDYERNFTIGIATEHKSFVSNLAANRVKKEVANDGINICHLSSIVNTAISPQDEIFLKADGIILAFDPSRAEIDLWENLYTLMSTIVAEQTHDKAKFLKPTKLVNTDNAFDNIIKLVDDFHRLGTVPQDPASLFEVVKTVDEAIEALERDRTEYVRLVQPSYITGEKNKPVGRPPTKDFKVAIFASATNENSKYLEQTSILVDDLIKNDFGLVSGAGLYSMMGIITEMAHAKRTSHAAQHLGSNVPHIMLDEGEAEDKMHQFLLANTIYERMEYMIDNSDAFAIMPGGTGTVQEFALLALLKKRALEDANDSYAINKMAGKDIIIINSQINITGNVRGFYDKLLDIIPEGDCKALGIHVVNTPEAAAEKLKELRAAKFPGKNFRYWEESNSKNSARAL